MAMIRVDTARMSQVAAQLRQLNSRLTNESAAMDSQARTLAGQWDGPSHDTFNNAYNRNQNEFKAFSALIEEYCRALDNYVTNYINTENRNKTIAPTR